MRQRESQRERRIERIRYRLLTEPFLLATVLFLSTTLSLYAQGGFENEGDNLGRGFDPQKAFAFGDVDSINTFNGNLVLTIPIGQTYATGGGFSYGLQLVYNSSIWDFDRRFDPNAQWCNGDGQGRQVVRAWPGLDFNAGVGWKLTLGQLYGPNDLKESPLETHPADPVLAVHKGPGWLYIAPDGSRHSFSPTQLHFESYIDPEDPNLDLWYTSDNSFLRLKGKRDDQVVTIEFPDGTAHEFEKFDSELNVFRVRTIRDRRAAITPGTGNYLNIAYAANGLQWTLTDSVGRQHRVVFREPPPGSFYDRIIDRVELAGFGSGTSVYTFEYTFEDITRACADDDFETSARITVPLLNAVQHQTESWAYRATYLAPGGCLRGGKIAGLTLPTGGKIEWSYGFYEFPDHIACSPEGPFFCQDPAATVIGVTERRVFENASANTPTGVWTYQQELEILQLPPGSCDEFYESRTIVTNPLGSATPNPTDHRTVHYYSIYSGGGTLQGLAKGVEYGLPLTRRFSHGDRYLSTQQFDEEGELVRSTYVRYAMDVRAAGPNNHRRLTATRTVYDDDGGRFADTAYSDYDGLGNFRTITTGGNFGSGDTRITVTNFNPGRGTYCGHPSVDPDCNPAAPPFVAPGRNEPWILGLYSESRVEEGADGAKSLFCFDPNTGSLLGQRTLKNRTAESTADILTTFLYDSRGDLSRQNVFGADTQSVPVGALCEPPPQPATHRVDHTYQFGTLATSHVVDDCSGAAVLRTAHNTVDRDTGLVSASKDAADVLSTFRYDLLGRLVWQKPQETAGTQFIYNLNTYPAELTSYRRTSLSGQILTTRTTKFDGLGRPIRTLTLMPKPGGGTQLARRDTEYNALGWQVRQSTTGVGNPSNWTLFRHDALGRVIHATAPDGSVAVTRFSGVRAIEGDVWVNGVKSTTTGVYDRQGRLVQVTEPSGTSGGNINTFYTYDYSDRLTRVSTNANGVNQTRQFDYDRRGFLLSEKHPEIGSNGNGTIRYSRYDARGKAGRKNTVGGPTLDFVYDAAGRLTQLWDGVRSRLLKESSYGRNNAGLDRRAGKLVRAKRHNWVSDLEAGGEMDVVLTESFTYTGRDGRLSKKRIHSSHGFSALQGFTYNQLGNLRWTDYPVCDRPPCAGAVGPARRVSFSYSQGLLISVQDSLLGPLAPSMSYHPNGLSFEVLHGNGVTARQANDPFGMARPASISFTGGSVGWASGNYTYDGVGNVTAIGPNVYRYDKVSRLERGTIIFPGGSGTQQLSYDAFGNIASLSTGGASEPITVVRGTNRLAMAGVGYDAAGNLTNWAGNTYRYDPLNRMFQIQGDGLDKAYLYDPSDNRVATLDYRTGDQSWTLRSVNNKVVRRFSVKSGVVTWEKDYIHRGAALLASVSPAGTKHFHSDHLGSTRLVTDENGAEAARYDYYPFGQLAFSTGDEKMLFTGHERDFNCEGGCSSSSSKDDLDYMLARFYSPAVGRFLGVDPIPGKVGHPQSWNLYTYTGNNPLNNIDPTGKAKTAADLAQVGQDKLQFAKDYWIDKASDHGLLSAGLTGAFLGTLLDMASGALDVFKFGEGFGGAIDAFGHGEIARGIGGVGQDALRAFSLYSAGSTALSKGAITAVGEAIIPGLGFGNGVAKGPPVAKLLGKLNARNVTLTPVVGQKGALSVVRLQGTNGNTGQKFSRFMSVDEARDLIEWNSTKVLKVIKQALTVRLKSEAEEKLKELRHAPPQR